MRPIAQQYSFVDVEELKVWLCYVVPLLLLRRRRWRMRPIVQHYSFVDVEELKVGLCYVAPLPLLRRRSWRMRPIAQLILLSMWKN